MKRWNNTFLLLQIAEELNKLQLLTAAGFAGSVLLSGMTYDLMVANWQTKVLFSSLAAALHFKPAWVFFSRFNVRFRSGRHFLQHCTVEHVCSLYCVARWTPMDFFVEQTWVQEDIWQEDNQVIIKLIMHQNKDSRISNHVSFCCLSPYVTCHLKKKNMEKYFWNIINCIRVTEF